MPLIRFAVALVCLSFACATPDSGAPGTYGQGIYRPGPPPRFTPAEDAPHTVGQPGHVRSPESYPKSPHKRPLPPTQEPGLWTGDGARSSIEPPGWRDREPLVLGISLPEPEEGLEEIRDLVRLQNRICAEIFSRFDARYLKGEAASWPTQEKRCFVAMIYAHCANREKRNSDRAKADGTAYDRTVDGAVKWRRDRAEQWVNANCVEPPITRRAMQKSSDFEFKQGELDWRRYQ